MEIVPNCIYTVEQVAEMMGVSPITIKRRLKDGTLKGRKFCGPWRILGSEIIEYMRGGEGAQGDR